MKMENPSGMWTLLPKPKNGIYQIKSYGGTANSLFNSLPNSTHLVDGRQVKYLGFFEGNGGSTFFKEPMLLVVLKGNCIANGKILHERNSTFARSITCAKKAIVLAFGIEPISKNIRKKVKANESKTQISSCVTKCRVYSKKWGKNLFFAAPSYLEDTCHAFTQTSIANTARGAHADDFAKKTFVLHSGEVEMRTYFPEKNAVVYMDLKKTEEYYESYTISGHCYHSFYAITDALNTIFVNEPFSRSPKRFPLKALWPDRAFTASKCDSTIPSEKQFELIDQARNWVL